MSNYEAAGSLGLDGKIVAVVGGGGANNGIGRATAILFAKLGAIVAVLDINSEAAAETARLINAVAENGASVWLPSSALSVTVEQHAALPLHCWRKQEP